MKSSPTWTGIQRLQISLEEESRIPTDRPIDGIDQSDFVTGKQEKSNREHVVTYVGDVFVRGEMAQLEDAFRCD